MTRTKGRQQMRAVNARNRSLKQPVFDVNVVEDMVDNSFEAWILIPMPIPQLTGTPKKRAEFEKAVKDSRYELTYDINKWDDVRAAARELSDRGGIERVRIARVKHVVTYNSEWIDGKQVGKNG